MNILIKKIFKNNTENTIQIVNRDIPPGGSYDIPPNLWDKLLITTNFCDLIVNGSIIVNDGIEDLSPDKACKHINRLNPFDFYSSFAIDKNNVDQDITTSWTTVTANNVLWDINGDYDVENNQFIIPRNGIYLLDLQMKLKSLINVSTVKLSLFKVGEEEDEEWFILDYKDYLSEISQFTAAIEFDMYRGEKYKIKIKMTGGLLVNGEIDGNDVYTAWGLTFQKPLFI